nr:DUF5134 domain-containing protein [Streptomyces taklimakanensis]
MLVALCGGVGAACLWRLRDGPPERRRAAAGEAPMGLGMAVMAVPTSALEPPPPQLFAALFGVVAGYELALAASGSGHRSHHLHHAVGALAMVHMALGMAAPSPTGAHGHHTAASLDATGPTGAVTAVLLAYFAVYVLRTGVRPVPAGSPVGGTVGGTAGGGTPWPPEMAAACRSAMGLGMFTMLLVM